MDEIDRANDLADRALGAAIGAARSAGREAEPTGECLNCGEALAPGRRWCDAECREDWQARRGRR